MVIPRPRSVSCTLCGARFTLVVSAMIHPADVLCDACVLSLWASEQPDEVLMAECAAKVSPDLGMSPDLVADAILERVRGLRQMARERPEVEFLLRQRAGERR